jgi:Sugar (and other) transporter
MVVPKVDFLSVHSVVTRPWLWRCGLLGIYRLEVYPLEVRGKGSATGSITHWVLDFVIASTVLNLINTITETGTFWLYGVFGIIGIVFFFRVVPETRGRTLEEIEEELERRVSTGSETEAASSRS